MVRAYEWYDEAPEFEEPAIPGRSPSESGQDPVLGGVPVQFACCPARRIGSVHPSVTFFVGENGTGKSTLLVATEIDELDEQPSFGPPLKDSYGGRSLHEQSHGESFLALFANRLGGEGLYIVDEPEAALSPTRQLSLLAMIHDLVLKGSQFIIATHSPILMAYPKAKIYLLTENALEEVDYTATEHFSLTRAFLNDHRAMLRRLLGEDIV